MTLTIVGKICSRCNEEFPATAEFFFRKHDTKDGLTSGCKKCSTTIIRRHEQSEKGKRTRKEYRRTDKYKVTRKKYDKSERGIAVLYKKRKNRTVNHKADIAVSNKKYNSSIKGHLKQVFANMKKRCYNVDHHKYSRYGGRGIKILFESLDDFRNYVIDVLKVDPRGLTIDRINNDGNYEKGNIRFVTNFENCQNRDNQRKSGE